jgi:hypothetical protein
MFVPNPYLEFDEIYALALFNGKWSIQDMTTFNEISLARGTGDSGRFYFPLRNDLGIFNVDRRCVRRHCLLLTVQQGFI